MVKRLLFSTFFFWGFHNLSAQYSFTGTFLSKLDSLPAVGVVIKFDTYKKVKVTDQNGQLNATLDEAPISFEVRSNFFKDTVIYLPENYDVFYLNPTEIKLSEVIVSSSSMIKESHIMGFQQLNAQQIKNLPAIAGEKDLLKNIQLIPGVSNSVDGASGINVRGGKVDHNLILFNNIPILGSSSLFGFLSPINPSLIGTANIYKGTIPAYLGGRASSVIDILSKPLNLSSPELEVNLGLLTSKISYSMPLISNKLGVKLALRRNSFRQIKKLGGFIDTQNIPNYWMQDIYTEGDWLISGKAKIQLFHLGTFENWKTSSSNNSLYSQSPSNKILGINYDQHINDQLFQKVTMGISAWQINIKNEFDLEDTEKYRFTNSLIFHTFKYLISYEKGEKHTFDLGAEIKHIKNQSINSAYFINNKLASNYFQKNDLFVYTLQLSGLTQLSSIFNIHFGERLNFFKGSVIHEPGLSLEARFGNFKLKVGYQEGIQLEQLLTNNGLGPNEDLWVLSQTKKGKYIKSKNSFISIDKSRELGRFDLYWQAEAYYKSYTGNYTWLDGLSSSSFTMIEENPSSSILSSSFDIGQTNSYGTEFTIGLKKSKFKTDLAYTWSKSIERYDKINMGQSFYSNFDRPHILSIQTQYNLNHKWLINFLWAYRSGRPVTLPIGIIHLPLDIPNNDLENPQIFAKQVSFALSRRNEFRMQAFHSLDLGIKRNVKYKQGEGDWELSINNLYNRYNPSYYSATLDQRDKVFKINKISLFPLIISLSTFYYLK